MKTLLILLLLPMPVLAGVYKCDVGGKTVYQQVPCATGGQDTGISTHGNNALTPEQARRELQRRTGILQQEPSSQPPSRSTHVTPIAQHKAPLSQCRGLVVHRVTPYTNEQVSVNLESKSGSVSKLQCAELIMSLDALDGRLYDSAGIELKGRLFSQLANGSAAKASSVNVAKSGAGPRIVRARQYTVRACFGNKDFPVATVGCSDR